jgi:hypothetical protein
MFVSGKKMTVSLFLFVFVTLCMHANDCSSQNKANTVFGWYGEAPLRWSTSGNRLVIEEGDDHRGENSKLMRISELVAENIVETEPFNVIDQTFFRLSFKLKCNTKESEPLRVLVRYMNDLEGSNLGTPVVFTSDTVRTGVWQDVTAEVRTPWTTTRCSVIITRPGNGTDTNDKDSTILITPPEILIIPNYTPDDRYDLDLVSASLEKISGTHPRLFLTKDRISNFRKIKDTTHQKIWNHFLSHASKLVKQEPTKYDPEYQFEQLFMREVGNNIPTLAFAWLLTNDRSYLEAAKAWAMEACSYPTWGILGPRHGDLAAGHQLFGLALLYDWCYDDLDKNTRMIIRETILTRGRRIYDYASRGILQPEREVLLERPWYEWDEAWLQNHLWINSCGLATAAMAIFDENETVLPWVGFTLNRYATTMSILGHDGASHEGIGYWTYGVEWMLRFMALSEDIFNINFFANESIPGLSPDMMNAKYEAGDWWQNTAQYFLYMTTPFDSWSRSSKNVNYGDSGRGYGYGPSSILRYLASQYNDGYAQWTARILMERGFNSTRSRWLDMIWYNPDVEEKAPVDLPTLKHYDDMGFLTSRSGWEGNSSLLFFKCGPYAGKKATNLMTYCFSSAHHVHPDVGNFMLFGSGEWLIRDDGTHKKFTRQHNTLLIDGKGQYGEGADAFDGSMLHALKAMPEITVHETSPQMDHMSGDVTPAYPQELGLEHFTRHLVYLKPDILIVIDDIEMDTAHNLELRFFPEQQKSTKSGSSFFTQGEKAKMRLEPLTEDDVTISAEAIDAYLRTAKGTDPHPYYAIRLAKSGKTWRNAVAISWSGVNEKPAQILLEQEGDLWKFIVKDSTVTFDWKAGRIR